MKEQATSDQSNSGICANCWYCNRPGFLYHHEGGYNVSLCDACRDAGNQPPAAPAEPLTDKLTRRAQRYVDNWNRHAEPTEAAGPLIRELLAAHATQQAAIDELRRVVAMSLAHDAGGQQVGPTFPGRMPPSMARHFARLLGTEPQPTGDGK